METTRKPELVTAGPQAAQPLPDWLQATPEELVYRVQVLDWNNGTQSERQSIDLTRDEYAAIRVYLAGLRGIQLTPEQVERMKDTPPEDADSTERAA